MLCSLNYSLMFLNLKWKLEKATSMKSHNEVFLKPYKIQKIKK
jgi:hypothetical protein